MSLTFWALAQGRRTSDLQRVWEHNDQDSGFWVKGLVFRHRDIETG